MKLNYLKIIYHIIIMVKDNELYNRLGVSPTADKNDIKKAYRKLSIKYHPDKNPNDKDGATKKFQEISEAYSVLNDDEKRKQYDQFGMESLKEGGGPGMNPEDIFSQFFGGGNPFGEGTPFGFNFGQQQQHKEKEDIIVKIKVTLKQIYCEEITEVNFSQKIYCKDCNGSGSKTKTKTKCSDCNGKGKRIQMIRMGPMVTQTIQDCPKCGGKGEYVTKENRCPTCQGVSYTVKNKSISFPLRNGLDEGNRIQMEKKGHVFIDQKTDLIIVINIIKDRFFERRGPNLITKVNIKLYQALFGFDKILKHLNNDLLHISSSSHTEDKSIKKIAGKGMKDLKNGRYGDLFIEFNIQYPDVSSFSEEEINNLKKILSKNDKIELDTEESIKNGTIKTIKTVLEDSKIKETEKPTSHDEDDSPPQCTQS